jgi:hypothetical protein
MQMKKWAEYANERNGPEYANEKKKNKLSCFQLKPQVKSPKKGTKAKKPTKASITDRFN